MVWQDYNNQNTSGEKAVWNIDDEILKIIKDLKVVFLKHLMNWELEDAYWVLDLICMECDAKLKKTEKEEVEKSLKKLEDDRKKYSFNTKEMAGDFYVGLRDLYKQINNLMKIHGVWFREFEDDEGL